MLTPHTTEEATPEKEWKVQGSRTVSGHTESRLPGEERS